jgi:hypothetical protein
MSGMEMWPPSGGDNISKRAKAWAEVGETKSHEESGVSNTPNHNTEEERREVRGFPGFLIRLRKSGVLSRWPASYACLAIALYSHRDKRGFAWPGTRTLAHEAGTRVRTAQRFLKWAKSGLGIKVVGRKGRAPLYYLPLNEHVDPYGADWQGKRPLSNNRPRQA